MRRLQRSGRITEMSLGICSELAPCPTPLNASRNACYIVQAGTPHSLLGDNHVGSHLDEERWVNAECCSLSCPAAYKVVADALACFLGCNPLTKDIFFFFLKCTESSSRRKEGFLLKPSCQKDLGWDIHTAACVLTASHSTWAVMEFERINQSLTMRLKAAHQRNSRYDFPFRVLHLTAKCF